MSARVIGDWTRSMYVWLFLVLVSVSLWWGDGQGTFNGIRNPINQFMGVVYSWGYGVQVSIRERWFGWGSDIRQEKVELITLQNELRAGLVAGAAIARLEEENASLRKLLGAPLDPTWKFLPGMIIGRGSDSWWIDVGSAEGVEIGMLVVAEDLLIGRVEGVEKSRAEVVPLDAPGTRWKVEVRDAETGLMHGEGVMEPGNDGLVVRQLLLTEEIYKGDLVVTKGDDGILPGVPIGQVLSLGTLGETSLYQHAVVWWPLDRTLLRHVAVIYDW